MKTAVFLLCCVFLLFISCSMSQFGWKVEGDAESAPKSDGGIVEDWDPLSVQEEDIVVPEMDLGEPGRQAASSEIEQPKEMTLTPDAPSEDSPDQILGFRVQLAASGSESLAWEEKKRAMLRFNEKVYLIFDAQYKIRVGDCRTRTEAKSLREKAIQKGYSDAWIVRSKVNLAETFSTEN